jgi:hypothetical protein
MGWCIYLSISNGALMQVLIGSLCSDNRLPQASLTPLSDNTSCARKYGNDMCSIRAAQFYTDISTWFRVYGFYTDENREGMDGWQANAIISFNNKPAADAVPFFDQVFLCMSLLQSHLPPCLCFCTLVHILQFSGLLISAMRLD